MGICNFSGFSAALITVSEIGNHTILIHFNLNTVDAH